MIKFTNISNSRFCRLNRLEVGETFIYNNQFGLVIQVQDYDSKFNEKYFQKNWIDLSTGKELMENETERLTGNEKVEPITLYLTNRH